jgi:hypothetical protein
MNYNTNFDDNDNQSQISHESNVSLRTQYTRRSSKQQQHQQPLHQNETYTTSHFNNEHNHPYNTESTSQYNATQFTRHKATNPFPQPDSRRIFDPSLQDDETDTNNNNEHSPLKLVKGSFNIETATKFNPKKYATHIHPTLVEYNVDPPLQPSLYSGTDRQLFQFKK